VRGRDRGIKALRSSSASASSGGRAQKTPRSAGSFSGRDAAGIAPTKNPADAGSLGAQERRLWETRPALTAAQYRVRFAALFRGFNALQSSDLAIVRSRRRQSATDYASDHAVMAAWH